MTRPTPPASSRVRTRAHSTAESTRASRSRLSWRARRTSAVSSLMMAPRDVRAVVLLPGTTWVGVPVRREAAGWAAVDPTVRRCARWPECPVHASDGGGLPLRPHRRRAPENGEAPCRWVDITLTGHDPDPRADHYSRPSPFRVHPDAHKTQIRQAIEQLWGVKVSGVWTSQQRGKTKRMGRSEGRRGLDVGARPRAVACDVRVEHGADGDVGDDAVKDQRDGRRDDVVQHRGGGHDGGPASVMPRQ